MSETKKDEAAKAPKLNLSNPGEHAKSDRKPTETSIGTSGTLKHISH